MFSVSVKLCFMLVTCVMRVYKQNFLFYLSSINTVGNVIKFTVNNNQIMNLYIFIILYLVE